MLILYEYLGKKVKMSKTTAATISFWAGMVFWLALGSLLGLLICILTQSTDYVNVIGGTGAFFDIIFGFVFGLVRLLIYG